jgi:hypothetical protein
MLGLCLPATSERLWAWQRRSIGRLGSRLWDLPCATTSIYTTSPSGAFGMIASQPNSTLFLDLCFKKTPSPANYEDTDLEPFCSCNKKASGAMPSITETSTNPAPAKATRKRQPVGASTLGTPDQNGKPITEEAVQVRAYQKWESAGKPAGDGLRFWLEAERELLQAK